MKILRKFLWGILGIFMVAVLAISMYGLGTDILEHLPLWLSKFALGAMAFSILVIVAIIFALGLLKIKDWIKE